MKKIHSYRFDLFLVGFSISCLLMLGAFHIKRYVKVDVLTGEGPIEVWEYTPISSFIPEEPEKQEEKKVEKPIRKVKFPTDHIELVEDQMKLKKEKFKLPVLPKLHGLVNIPKLKTEETVFTYYEQKASFPGGDDALKKYMERNIRFPEGADIMERSAYVRIKFIVEKDGSLSDIEVISDNVGHGVAEDAVRALQLMPRWNPATINGVGVRTYYVIPIRIEVL